MQEGVKWWAISPHLACKQGVFGVTTKHAGRGEMVGHFSLTTKHAGRDELVGQARSVWVVNQACK